MKSSQPDRGVTSVTRKGGFSRSSSSGRDIRSLRLPFQSLAPDGVGPSHIRMPPPPARAPRLVRDQRQCRCGLRDIRTAGRDHRLLPRRPRTPRDRPLYKPRRVRRGLLRPARDRRALRVHQRWASQRTYAAPGDATRPLPRQLRRRRGSVQTRWQRTGRVSEPVLVEAGSDPGGPGRIPRRPRSARRAEGQFRTADVDPRQTHSRLRQPGSTSDRVMPWRERGSRINRAWRHLPEDFEEWFLSP